MTTNDSRCGSVWNARSCREWRPGILPHLILQAADMGAQQPPTNSTVEPVEFPERLGQEPPTRVSGSPEDLTMLDPYDLAGRQQEKLMDARDYTVNPKRPVSAEA
jgi:hypothetical protein